MNGFRFSGTQLGELCSYRSIVFASYLFLLFPGVLLGQSYTYIEEGTDLKVDITDQSSSPISYKLIKFIPPYSINPSSPFSVDWSGSWLCDEGNCTYNLSFDESKGEITLEIEAYEARSGAGRIAFLKGIIIEPEDIERIGDQLVGLNVYPNPARHRLLIEPLAEQEKLVRTQWMSLDGRKVSILIPDPSGKSLNVSGLARGIYAVIFETKTQRYHKRIVLR